MKKLLSAVLLGLWLFTSTGSMQTKGTVPEWLDRISRSVVALRNESGKFFCSGFVIRQDTIQTAYHCLMSSGEELKVDGKQVAILYADPKLDSATLGVPTGGRKALRPAVNQPLPGQVVYSIGHAAGQKRLTTTYGGVREVQGKYLITDPIVIAGMSGGPVLNKDGEVVGMNHMSFSREFHESDYALNIKLLRERNRSLWEF